MRWGRIRFVYVAQWQYVNELTHSNVFTTNEFLQIALLSKNKHYANTDFLYKL